jgi:hypothetical protein
MAVRYTIVFIVPPPAINLGQDTTLCDDETILLSAANNTPGSTYLWSTGSSDKNIKADKSGTYWVQVNGYSSIPGAISFWCTARDTIHINYDHSPQFSLGPDRLICKDEEIVLQADISNVKYLWQDGSVNSSFTAVQSGVYYLQATNDCDAVIDSVVLKPGLCELMMPKAFTPNSDGKNDIFRIPPGINVNLKEFSVYNRWGEMIFTTRDISKGWGRSL